MTEGTSTSTGTVSIEPMSEFTGRGIEGLEFDENGFASIGWKEWSARFLVADEPHGSGDFVYDLMLPDDVDRALVWTEVSIDGCIIAINGMHGGSSTWGFRLAQIPIPEGLTIEVVDWATPEEEAFIRGAITEWQRTAGMPSGIVLTEEFTDWFRAVHPEHRDLVHDYFPELAAQRFNDLSVYENEDEYRDDPDDDDPCTTSSARVTKSDPAAWCWSEPKVENEEDRRPEFREFLEDFHASYNTERRPIWPGDAGYDGFRIASYQVEEARETVEEAGFEWVAEDTWDVMAKGWIYDNDYVYPTSRACVTESDPVTAGIEGPGFEDDCSSIDWDETATKSAKGVECGSPPAELPTMPGAALARAVDPEEALRLALLTHRSHGGSHYPDGANAGAAVLHAALRSYRKVGELLAVNKDSARRMSVCGLREADIATVIGSGVLTTQVLGGGACLPLGTVLVMRFLRGIGWSSADICTRLRIAPDFGSPDQLLDGLLDAAKESCRGALAQSIDDLVYANLHLSDSVELSAGMVVLGDGDELRRLRSKLRAEQPCATKRLDTRSCGLAVLRTSLRFAVDKLEGEDLRDYLIAAVLPLLPMMESAGGDA